MCKLYTKKSTFDGAVPAAAHDNAGGINLVGHVDNLLARISRYKVSVCFNASVFLRKA